MLKHMDASFFILKPVRPMKISKVISLMMLVFWFLLNAPARLIAKLPGDNQAALLEEIRTLKERISILESKILLSSIESHESVSGGTKVQYSPPSMPERKGIEMHWFVDTSYIYNVNTPVSPNPQTNNLRVFDRTSNGFMFHLAEIN
ncbi:MAG: hypothetical protein NC930_05745, partial [Candidatus Omnitrophica bacterium]|nr:hypothetical protein [Candidatus Omnitrophota bacterium]